MLGSRYALPSVCRCGSAHYILHEELELILNQLYLLAGCCTQSSVLYRVSFPAKIRKLETLWLVFSQEAGASVE